jgi:hypothetical protein
MDGGTPIPLRARLMEDFNANPDVPLFLLTTKVGGNWGRGPRGLPSGARPGQGSRPNARLTLDAAPQSPPRAS